MIRRKKIFAMLIAVLMLMSNFMGLLGNISLAIQNNVTVEFSVENDGSAHLSEDGTTLNYECGDGSSYDFQLRQNGEAIVLTKNPDSVNGDKYIATGISSNENLQVYSPRVNLGVISLFFGGVSMGMVPERENGNQDYYTVPLIQMADENHYQFRIQETHNGDGDNPNPNNYNDADFTVDFRPTTWTIEEEITTARIEGKDLTSEAVTIKGNTDIELLNWNPALMEACATFVLDAEGHEFNTRLGVREEEGKYYTRIADAEAGNLPERIAIFFSVVKHQEENHGDPQLDMSNTVFSVDFRPASWEVRNKTTEASVTIDDQNLELTKGRVDIRGDQIIKLSNWDSKLMQAVITVVDPQMDPENYFSTRLNVSASGETRIMDIQSDNIPWGEEGMYIEFRVERYTGEQPEWNLPESNTSANVTISSSQTYAKSYKNARICINGFGINLEELEQKNISQVPESTTINDFRYFYDAEKANGKVTITFSAIFLNKYVGSVVVNGQEFNVSDFINYSDRTNWLNHYSHQEVGFDVTVDKANNYNIVVNLDDMGEDIYIGNFLWTDDPNESRSDLYIGNSTLKVVSVKYKLDGKEIYVEEQDLADDPHIEYNPYGIYGSLVVPEGAMCTMRIIPDYGYQVTSFGVNGGNILTGDAISEFTFPIHRGNFHLMAQVTKVDDVVASNTDKVKSGSIEIDANEIDSGTVVLSVYDVVDLNDEKTAKFEETAGDYEISSYLDINLDQVIYKGTAENVWANQIHELHKEATIELELEEDLSNKNIIVLHNIGNGNEYEVIEIEKYDSETNTVTFKTNSFSNYAIAVQDKTVEPEEPTEPEEPVNPVDPENPSGPVDPENPDEPEVPENPEEKPAVSQEKYTITEGGFTAIFSDDEGHEFELEVIELLHLTPEELAEMDLTEEEYEKAKQEITENLKEYGTIVNVYGISIYDGPCDHTSEVTIRIKMTEEMKKYNTFRLICIDNEQLTDKDVIELKIEGDELVGNLFHLSNYALVAQNVETQNTTNNVTEETKTNNPKTGDNIMFYVTMFVIAVIGMNVVIKYKK